MLVLGCEIWAGERDSVTETILPIVVTGTLKVSNAKEVKGEKSGVRAHSAVWRQAA